jgi:bacterial/archaeal transporter family-2 protein
MAGGATTVGVATTGLVTLGCFAVLAGVATAFQPPINAQFASHSTSRLHGGWINFVVGMVVMTVVCLVMRTPLPTAQPQSCSPWWAYLGGVLGAFFVTTAVFAVPRLGAVNYLVLMIVGQMIANSVIDHYGWMGLAQQSFTWGRGVGLVLIVAGIACIRLL